MCEFLLYIEFKIFDLIDSHFNFCIGLVNHSSHIH